MNVMEDIRKCTYGTCNYCLMRMRSFDMEYIGCKKYQCKNCNVLLHIDNFCYLHVHCDMLREYVLSSLTPRKCIKMFIVKILRLSYQEEQISNLLKIFKNKKCGLRLDYIQMYLKCEISLTELYLLCVKLKGEY